MKTIAILGASADRSKYGNKAVRAYRQEGYEVYPVNPKEEEIEGLSVSSSLTEVPSGLDRISIYLPPKVTEELLDEIADAGAREVWFNPGADDGGLLDKARERGIEVVQGCSIRDLGLDPDSFS